MDCNAIATAKVQTAASAAAYVPYLATAIWCLPEAAPCHSHVKLQLSAYCLPCAHRTSDAQSPMIGHTNQKSYLQLLSCSWSTLLQSSFGTLVTSCWPAAHVAVTVLIYNMQICPVCSQATFVYLLSLLA